MRTKTGAVLVALQIAISLAILANALHVVNLRQAVASRPSGVADESSIFYIVARNLPKATHEEELATQARETALLRALPGVQSVAITSQHPLSNNGSTSSFFLSPDQVENTGNASFYISPDSLVKTWGLQLVEGRDFTPDDVQEIDQTTSKKFVSVVIVTKALAKKAFPDADSYLGKTIYFGSGPDAKGVRIVGVVERLQSTSAQVGESGETSVILPVRLTGFNTSIYTVRAAPGERDRLMKDAETAMRHASPTPMSIRITSMDQDRKERYQADVGLGWTLVAVSVLLMLITVSGIVGMTSLRVSQRRKQIGVRRAVGARRIDILRYFLLENLFVTAAGIVLG
ncbi:MAG: ABC transporter permease, partial [Burkholderiales bacterium PBB4]